VRGRGRVLAGICGLLALPAFALAQEPQVHARVEPSRVAEGTEVELTIEILGTNANPDEPPDATRLPGFVVAAGPSVSSHFQWINGQTTASRTYTWTLLPQGVGQRTIPPLEVRLGGRVYRTEPLRVDVVPRAGPGAGAPAPRPQVPQPSSPFRDPVLRRRLARPPDQPASIFVEAVLSKPEVFVGEQVLLEYKVYTQYEIAQMSLKDQPTYPGFWVEEIQSDDKYEARGVNRSEGKFVEYTVLKKALFPTGPGTLRIEPLTFHFNVRRRTGDFFDSFFFTPSEGLFRSSNAVTIRVRPLPEEGKPDGFEGAVGRFTLSARADRSEAKVNDAVGLQVTVEGQGNIRTLPRPELPDLHDFQRYDPKVEQTVQARDGTVVGTKRWDYVLIPLAAGRQEIPAVRFSYFDPFAAQYRVLETRPLTLAVAKGGMPDLAAMPPGPARSEIPVLGSDIRYIRLGGDRIEDQGETLYGSRAFALLLAAPLVLNAGLLVVARRRAALTANQSLLRRRRAKRAARRRLARARAEIAPERARDFYQELAAALTGYLADKSGVSAAGLTYDRIEEILAARGVGAETRRRFRECLEGCDFARFAPASSRPEEMEKALREASALIQSLEGAGNAA
jgi:hypothetical protein